MNKLQTFEHFLSNNSAQISILSFIINILLASIMALILGAIYTRFGQSLSNRKKFASSFIQITVTTMLIITIVKSSLALSLGLVGALSIIRFRTAVKEPEELAYLFFTISIGLGMGADQTIITIIGFSLICAMICCKAFFTKKEVSTNLYLTLSSKNIQKFNINELIELLKEHCLSLDLKRYDETVDGAEALFLVDFGDIKKFSETREAVKKVDESMTVRFLDNSGAF